MHLRPVLIAVLAAGCYTPSIAPCLYACDDNQCPSGLTCMAGMCTNAETGVCTGGDGGVDAPRGPTTHVTIEVRNLNDNPLEGATVIFTDAVGETVAPNEMTNSAGMASADIPVHSNVTIVRANGGGDLAVTTFVDIWPDAHLVSQFDHQLLGNATVSVNWASDGSSVHKIYTSCGGTKSLTLAGQTGTTVDIPRECASYDILVVAANGANSGMVASVSTSTVTVPLINSKSFTPTFSHQPAVADARVNLGVNAYLTDAQALTVPFISGININGSVGPFPVPMNTKLMMQIDGTVTLMGADWTQRYLDRFGVFGPYARDLDTTFMEWMGPVTNSIGMGKLTWPATKPPSIAVSAPSMVFAGVSFRRAAQTVVWHVIGPESMIARNGSNREITFPVFAATLPFEPLSTDTPLTATVETYLVTPAAAELPVRSFLEQRRTTLDVWDIVGLKSVTVAKPP